MDYSQVIGAIVAVSVACAPAVFALFKIKALHVLINSRLTELIEAVRIAARAEGRLAGRKEAAEEAGTTAKGLITTAEGKAEGLLATADAAAREHRDEPPAVLAVPASIDAQGKVTPDHPTDPKARPT